MMWLISKVVRQKYNSSGNLQRSNLVWAVFENVVLSETLDDLRTFGKFTFTFRSSRSQLIFKIDVIKILQYSQGRKHLCWGLFCNFINKRLQHRCFPVNVVKFLKATFEQLRGLLVYFGQ